MMLTPPLALKVHEPYIRHESGESSFLVALFLVDQATRFVMGMEHNETVVADSGIPDVESWASRVQGEESDKVT